MHTVGKIQKEYSYSDITMNAWIRKVPASQYGDSCNIPGTEVEIPVIDLKLAGRTFGFDVPVLPRKPTDTGEVRHLSDFINERMPAKPPTKPPSSQEPQLS